MTQREITQKADLLDSRGRLASPGWARDLVLRYDRRAIKASPLRIKEWDYYCILTDGFGAAFTIADNSYMGLVSASILDFTQPWEITTSVMTPFPMGKFNMPSSSAEGDAHFRNKRVNMAFTLNNRQRHISVDFAGFSGGKSLSGEISMVMPEPLDTMVIATPFAQDPLAFYYNQKINCMPASGRLRFGQDEFVFEEGKAWAVLDWGRGVWTRTNTWYWGSASGAVDGVPFGFNIGYGFGDTSAASENMVFNADKCHKLDQVVFNIPPDSFVKPWTLSSNDGRFEMDFVPIIDRYAKMNAVIISSVQHQVFGRFTGRVVLDDGRTLEIRDLMGFAEKVSNTW